VAACPPPWGAAPSAAGAIFGQMSILLLILGLLLGAAVAAALTRPRRDRVRDELKSISVDVLAQTGDSLAQRLTEQRLAEQERTSGEMARRAEEFKGLVRPMQEKLGRMEGEIARLERERREAHGELAQMVRTLGDGVGTLREETGNLVSARSASGDAQRLRALEPELSELLLATL